MSKIKKVHQIDYGLHISRVYNNRRRGECLTAIGMPNTLHQVIMQLAIGGLLVGY